MKRFSKFIQEAKLSQSQRDRLDDLILNVHMTTHPEYDGDEEPTKYLNMIRKEFGDKVAKQVDDGIDKEHWGRDNHTYGSDKLSWRKGNARITKSGKMNAQDVNALKNRIKRDKAWGGITKKVKLPEAVELEEKLKASDNMGDWVKDFQDSDAPQFKGKSQKKRQQMAVAAKLDAERNEEVELDEAIEVSHDRYMRSHGKKASGGEGSWMFTHKRMGDANVNDPKEVHSAPRGKFADAKKSAQQWAKKHGHSTVYVMEEVELDEVSASTLRSYVDKSRADKSRQQKARTVAKNDYKKYGIPSDKERADAAHSKASQRNSGISMAKRKLGGYTKGTQPKVLAREEVELDEAKTDIYHKHMLKALGKSRLPKGHQYTSAIATNGDFVVKDGGGRVAGRIPKGDHNLNEVSDKKLDAYRQKAFADQPAGDDGSNKYRKRKFGRDLAFAKQTGRAKVLATKEEVDLDEVYQETANYLVSEGIELESLNEEQLNELIGAVARGIGRGLKSTVVNKKGNFRFSTAGRADAAQKRADAVKKRSDNIERLRKQRERLAKERERLSNLRRARSNT